MRGGIVGPLIGQNRSLRVQITNPQCDKTSPIWDLNYQFGHITPNWVFSLFPPNTYCYTDVLNLKCFQEKLNLKENHGMSFHNVKTNKDLVRKV